MELLLLSNSTNYGSQMFAHAAAAFGEVAAGATVTFIPYALADWDDYARFRPARVPRRHGPVRSHSVRRYKRRAGAYC